MLLSEGWSLLGAEAEEERRATAGVAALVAAYGPLLFRVAHSVLRTRPEAEDVVQDVFVRVLRRPQGMKDVADVRVWLVRIAWNLALDRRRRLRVDQLDEGFAEGLAAKTVSAERQITEREQIERVLRLVDRLPRAEREVLLLSAVEELGTAEMAAVLERSESAVRALLHRARQRLRERLLREEGR